MKIMCVTCRKQLECRKNEVVVEELGIGSRRIWEADLWECPKCGTEIIVGFGLEPIMEHFQKDYRKILTKERKRVKVYQLEL